jgi:hypothetical protein
MRRIDREKKTIDAMLGIYCHAKHGPSQALPGGSFAGLCDHCCALQEYAHQRLDACPFHDNKPACNKCTVHCYAEKKRVQVKEVMRYAGPRMILRHPVLALLHLVDLLGKAPALKSRR